MRYTLSVLLFKLPFDNQVLIIEFYQNQHIVLLQVPSFGTEKVLPFCWLLLPVGICCILLLLWINRIGEKKGSDLQSLRPSLISYPRHWVQIFSIGCPVMVTVCWVSSAWSSQCPTNLFSFWCQIWSFSEHIFLLCTLISPTCMYDFPRCSFLLSVKT